MTTPLTPTELAEIAQFLTGECEMRSAAGTWLPANISWHSVGYVLDHKRKGYLRLKPTQPPEPPKPLFEVGKTYLDGLGRRVKIIYILNRADERWPVFGILMHNGEEHRRSYTKNGMFGPFTQSSDDLIPGALPETGNEPKDTREVVYDKWINIYPDGPRGHHKSREDAHVYAMSHRIACVRVVARKGEGL